MPTCVITSTGFIASNLRTRFLALGWHVVNTSRADSPRIAELLAQEAPDLVIHCAAEIYDADTMFKSNVILTHEILEYCRSVAPRCRLVHMGSSSEYGEKPVPSKETDVLEPRTIYEGTKAAATMLVQSWALTFGFQACVIRPYSVYGPGESSRRFTQYLLTRPEALSICPTPTHDFVYIDDFCDAVMAVFERQKKPFDLIDVGSGIATSNIDMVRIYEKVLGHKFDLDDSRPRKANDKEVWVADATYLASEYGFRCSISLEEGVRRMVQKSGV